MSSYDSGDHLSGQWTTRRLRRRRANVKGRMPVPGQVFACVEVLHDHLAARVIRVPLDRSGCKLVSLKCLVDALSPGIPVIVTRNPTIEVDVEADGIVHWVASGGGRPRAPSWSDWNLEALLPAGRSALALSN